MLAKFDFQKFATFSLGVTLTLLLVSANGFAQNLTQQITGPPESALSTDYREAKLSPFADSNLINRPTIRNDFTPPVLASPIAPPSFEQRDLAWKEKRSLAVKTNMPSPSTSEKYLISEVKILGLYQKPEGQGVFLKPTLAMGTTIFAMVGQEFWDGKIKKINKDSIEVEKIILLNTGKTKTEFQTIPFTRNK
ncbi:MAG: hypothetical protein HY819_19045 [Acidobacteria bacterium]|nr:hypothetical protein [Acidobacteriota bacterium]